MTERHPAEWCVHYCSPRDGDICKAGIRFDRFASTPFRLRPCYLDHGKSRPGAATCGSLRLPTPEEIEADRVHCEGSTERLMTAITGTAEWRKSHAGQNFGEVVECPVCKGKLHIRIAGRKSHMAGKCETEGCVEWLE